MFRQKRAVIKEQILKSLKSDIWEKLNEFRTFEWNTLFYSTLFSHILVINPYNPSQLSGIWQPNRQSSPTIQSLTMLLM